MHQHPLFEYIDGVSAGPFHEMVPVHTLMLQCEIGLWKLDCMAPFEGYECGVATAHHALSEELDAVFCKGHQ